MGSPMYKIVLGMSYYIHPGGLGALVDGLRPVFKESTAGAVNVLRCVAEPWLSKLSKLSNELSNCRQLSKDCRQLSSLTA